MRRLLPGGLPVPLDDLYLDLERPAAGGTRPVVRLGMIASVDGVAAVDGRSGALGGEADLMALRRLREHADLVLVGAGTVRAEGYGPVRLPADAERRRTTAGRAPVPLLGIVTATGVLGDNEERLRDHAGVILIAPEDAALPELGAATVLRAGRGEVALAEALSLLAGRGIASVVCEGGPRLAAELLSDGLVDEVLVTLAPRLVGTGPHLLDGAVGDGGRLELTSVHEHDGELLLRYRVSEPPR